MITNDTELHEYEVKLYRIGVEPLRKLAHTISETSKIKTEQHWSFIKPPDALHYLLSAVRVYAVVNTLPLRMKAGLVEDNIYYIERFLPMFRYPRYIRDLAREISRPMIDGRDVYVPDVWLLEDERGQLLTDVIQTKDANKNIENINLKLNSIFRDNELDIVQISREDIKPMPFCGYYRGRVFASAPVPEFRYEAMSLLQWAEFSPIQFTDMERSEETIRHRLLTQMFNNCHKLSGYISELDDGRMLVNSVTMWSKVVSTMGIPSWFGSGHRFPSEEMFSQTPPSTPRTDGPSKSKKKKKYSKSKTDPVKDPPVPGASKEETT